MIVAHQTLGHVYFVAIKLVGLKPFIALLMIVPIPTVPILLKMSIVHGAATASSMVAENLVAFLLPSVAQTIVVLTVVNV